MPTVQVFQIISIGAAFLVGFWLPIRLVDFVLPVAVDISFDLIISAVSVINIYLFFNERDLSAREPRNWLHVSVLLDFLCFLPLSLFEFMIFQNETQGLLLINLLASRHIWRIKSYLDSFDDLHPVLYRLIPLALTMPLLVHLVACGWIALGSGTAGPDADKILEYVKAIYWSFTTLTTVGYGDISAKSIAQMLYACGVQVTGVGVFGFVISNVASLLSRSDAAREHHMNSLDRVETFMQSHKIPTELRSKVRNYYHYLWTNHRGYQDRSLLEDLPTKVQSELYLFINKAIIKKVSFLNGAEPELIEDLMHELRPQIYVPGEKIFKVDEPGHALYFIQRGQVEILSREGKLIAHLEDGACFGEMALISDRSRSANARALSYCDVYVLEKESFYRVAKSYPQFLAHIQKIMNERQQAA